MPAYRAYFLDQDDHITGTEIIEVESLRVGIDAALEMLKELPDGHSLELWEGEKRRCTLPILTNRRRAQLRAAAHGSRHVASALKLELPQMRAISSKLAALRLLHKAS
jgi:hypothetical protein